MFDSNITYFNLKKYLILNLRVSRYGTISLNTKCQKPPVEDCYF